MYFKTQSRIFGCRFSGHVRVFEEQVRQQVVGHGDQPGPSRRRAESGRVETRTLGPIPVEYGETVL